jgi:hypothetical protein
MGSSMEFDFKNFIRESSIRTTQPFGKTLDVSLKAKPKKQLTLQANKKYIPTFDFYIYRG